MELNWKSMQFLSHAILRVFWPKSGRFLEAGNGAGTSSGVVHIDDGAMQHNAVLSKFEPLGHLGDEPPNDRFDLAAEDGFLRAREAGVAKKGGAAGKYLLVGSLHVGMGADDSTHPAVEVAAEGGLLAGRFGVDVHQNDARLLAKLGNKRIRNRKGVFQSSHKGAPLKIDDTDGRFAGAVPNDGAMAWHVGGIVGRTQDAWFFPNVGHEFLLVPDVITTGDDVHAGVQQLTRRWQRQAAAAGHVLGVGNDVVDLVALAQQPAKARDRRAARLTHDVADEKKLHAV